MCKLTQDVMDKLTQTVKQFLAEGRMFTALDVTVTTRTRDGLFLRHIEARDDIHTIQELFDAQDFGVDTPNGTVMYTKTQRPMPPKNDLAWVFHPTTSDINQYKPIPPAGASSLTSKQPVIATTTQQLVQPSIPSISVVNDGVTTDASEELEDGTFATDYRHRLLLPTRFFREAGIKAGDTVYVAADKVTSAIFLFKEEPVAQNPSIHVTTQRVERKGNMYLSSKTLSAAELNAKKFVIENSLQSVCGVTTKVVEVKVAPTTSK